MARKHRHIILGRIRRSLRERGLTDRQIAAHLVENAVQLGMVNESKYLTGTQFDLLCRPSSGKTVNQWLSLAAMAEYQAERLTPGKDDELAAYSEGVEMLKKLGLDMSI